MPGLLSVPNNNVLLIRALFITTSLVLLFSGCRSQNELNKSENASSSLREFILKHEGSFNPERYDIGIKAFERTTNSNMFTARTVAVVATPETTSGYRVQVLFTQDIDQATQLRDTLDILLPLEWIYIVYDAPYYKIRIGNYDDRTSAMQVVKQLLSYGFKDAWVVPDRILINIPQKPPVGDIEAVPRLGNLQ